LRLFRLQLAPQLKALEKGLNVRNMALAYATFGTETELREALVTATLMRALMQAPVARTQSSFESRREEGRGRISLIANELVGLAGRIIEERQAVLKKLPQAKPFANNFADLNAQLDRLFPKHWLTALPHAQLTHLPRYLKAMALRIDKLKADTARDNRLMGEFVPLHNNWVRAWSAAQKSAHTSGQPDTRLEEFRWLLEELRVSLFAQELKTPMPVSVKRLVKVWESYRRL
jgi:ATP-dependent helicase HrpA